jgi:hypothetical protein
MPEAVLDALNDWSQCIQGCEFLESLLEQEELKQIAQDLNQICLEKGIVGFHYTRAIRIEIETNGLQPSSGDARRRAFLDQYGHNFTDAQVARIRDIWAEYFEPMQIRARDNRIWFNFTLAALKDGGADRLLSYFGGEQIYMPLASDKQIGAILKTLGEPLIVRCNLNPHNLKTFSEYPWGKIWLSTYHLSQNPNAYQFDVDAYQTTPVSSTDIVISVPDIEGRT